MIRREKLAGYLIFLSDHDECFCRNRYDTEEFVRGFDSANVERDGIELCISFAISNSENEEMTIWFPGCPSNPSAELMRLARLTCLRITELDNLVQASCEEELKWTPSAGPENALDKVGVVKRPARPIPQVSRGRSSW